MSDILLRFVHLSDTHIAAGLKNDASGALHTTDVGARALVEAVNRLPFQPDFIMHTGDIVEDESYELARDIFQPLRAPVYYLRGNSDQTEAIQRVLMTSMTVNTPWLYYEFEVNGVQIVCLDTNGPAPRPAGNIVPEQLAWLEQLCSAADNRPLLVTMHHNPLRIGDVPFLDDSARINNGDDLHQILLKARHRLRGVFYGHIHQPLDNYRDGILYSAATSSWYQFYGWPGSVINDIPFDRETLPGFSVVTVSTTATTIRRHSFRVEA